MGRIRSQRRGSYEFDVPELFTECGSWFPEQRNIGAAMDFPEHPYLGIHGSERTTHFSSCAQASASTLTNYFSFGELLATWTVFRLFLSI